MALQEFVTGSNRAPSPRVEDIAPAELRPSPPQINIRPPAPVQTAGTYCRAVGAPVRVVALQLSVAGPDRRALPARSRRAGLGDRHPGRDRLVEDGPGILVIHRGVVSVRHRRLLQAVSAPDDHSSG